MVKKTLKIQKNVLKYLAPGEVEIMEKFNRTLRGYDPDEVNSFLDKVIKRVEQMVSEIDKKDAELKKLREELEKTNRLKEKLEQYERMEDTLNRAIVMAQKTSDQLKIAAHRESEAVLDDAKKNANRMVNEALTRAE